MGITAEDAYNKGIEMSLKYWVPAITDAQVAAYQAGTTTPVALPDFNTPPQSDLTVHGRNPVKRSGTDHDPEMAWFIP